MKLLISNQHGAAVMAALPFLFATLSGHPEWQQFLLFFAWASLYLFSYPFFTLFKKRKNSDQQVYKKWSYIYGLSAALFGVLAMLFQWKIIFFVLAMSPFALINIHYTRQHNERAVINDIASVITFCIAGCAAYYFATNTFDYHQLTIFLIPFSYLLGTIPYVKSMTRERKNPNYYRFSIIYHIIIIICSYFYTPWLALCYVPALIRAIIIPKKRMKITEIGLWETAISTLFLVTTIML